MRLLAATVCVAALAAGCGGGETREQRTLLPRETALRLAAQSDLVARQLRAGDACGARRSAQRLRSSVVRAVNGGRVPTAYREQLLRASNDLVARISCVAVSPPTVTTEDEDEEGEEEEERPEHAKPKKHDDKGKHKGHGRKKGK